MTDPAKPSPRRGLLWAGAVAILLTASAVAAAWHRSGGGGSPRLVFAETEIALAAPASATELTASFRFRNAGARPVRILQVETDCSCTSGAMRTDFYEPGASGVIEVVFKPGTRTGPQRKGVVVHTDNPAQPLVPLALVATIPEVMKLQASYLLWQAGEPPAPKSLTVHMSNGVVAQSVRATSDSPHLEVAVEELTPSEYRVHVTPRPNHRDISAAVHVEALLADNQRKQLNAFIRVR